MVSSMENGIGENRSKLNGYACACAIVASMISIIFGYDTGVMSGAMIFIKEEFTVKESQLEIAAGILNMCALVGSLCAGRTSDIIGRRYTIIAASLIFFLGSVLMGYSPNYSVLLAGRCTAGVGVGFALMIAPVYSAEISSPNSRGFLSSLPEVGISVGIVLGYISNVIFSDLPLHLGWRMMLGIAAIPSLCLAIGILKMPESPRWLVMQGRLGEAKKIMYKVSNDAEEAESRLKDIKKAAGIDENCEDDIVKLQSNENTGKGVWKELLLRPTPAVRWILLAAVGIHFFEHATGIEAVILYGPRIFKKAGVRVKKKLLLATVGVGLTKLTCITISTFLVDRVGRRKLLLISVGGMILALTGLATCLTIVDHSGDEKIIWALVLSLVATYSYVMFFNLGLGPVTWVYSSEIFPLKLRAQGAGICVAVNRLMNATVSMSFLSLSEAITIGGAFYLFAGVSVAAWLFFYFCCPETKGMALEDIESIFSRSRGRSPAYAEENANKEVELGTK
ncbi:hypothetical protein ACH5RR_011742 [Cinchona calisaya]|uniref:Major facilitator superfamily (MFS) profile domain-containing protein n=1 Tax=Cinchona calisaya TaxID=153742 RepID=A0ABD3A5S0_9GENT